MKDNCKGEGGKILTQYLSCVPFPPDSLFFNVFLLLWGALRDGCVEQSGRWNVSAASSGQSLTHFQTLRFQTTTIIQSPTSSSKFCYCCFVFFFFFALLQSTSHGDFSSAAFFKQRLWETEKVKQLTRCHLVNSLSLLFSHTSNSDGDPTRTLPSHPFSDFFSHVQFLASLINCLSSCAV